jgi:NAD(P)-dependent dehydrogenase (short-subunit alcohol dehydrogenase family)
VINIGSMSHAWTTLDLDDLQAERKFSPLKRYASSKIAVLLFTSELARRLEGTGVTVNALHPGAIKTNATDPRGKDLSFGSYLLYLAFMPFMRPPEEAARRVLRLAADPSLEKATGRYFFEDKEKPSSKETYDVEKARRLWEITERLVGTGAIPA